MSALGVALQALPMTFEGKRNAAEDAYGGEQAPAVQKAGLPWRKAHFLNGQEAVVMENETMNQRVPPRNRAILSHNGS